MSKNISFEKLKELHNLADQGLIQAPKDGFLPPLTRKEKYELLVKIEIEFE